MCSSVVRNKNSTRALLMPNVLFWTLIIVCFIAHNESVDNHVLWFVRMFTFTQYFYVKKKFNYNGFKNINNYYKVYICSRSKRK